jgi:hypothetical protein
MLEVNRTMRRILELPGLVVLPALALVLGLTSTATEAQTVVVRVIDSTNAPVAGAELTVIAIESSSTARQYHVTKRCPLCDGTRGSM